MVPNQLVEFDTRKRSLEKKTNFSLQEIQEHDRKYRELKIKAQKQKEEKNQLSKNNKINNVAHKYSRNVWIERIEEEEQRKK